jgi:hypothetical protein
VEALGGVIKPVLDRHCSIGIIGSLPTVSDELQSEPLLDLPFITVVSPTHRLAATRGVVSAAAVSKHVQLVLTDRTVLTEGRDFGVLSPLTWRLADLGAKHAFLKAGLGWGHMPLHMVKADLDSGGAGQDPGTRRSARYTDVDECGVSQRRTAGASGPSFHCATQAVIGMRVGFDERSSGSTRAYLIFCVRGHNMIKQGAMYDRYKQACAQAQGQGTVF